MNQPCLPCAVHDRKSLKDIVMKQIVERDHAIALLEEAKIHESNIHYDDAHDEFYRELAKHDVYEYIACDKQQLNEILCSDGVYEAFCDPMSDRQLMYIRG